MGNFSRNTFDKLKHYVGVRLQQGVPLVDADWNEQEDIRRFELETFLKCFVGNGVPEGNDGFRILPIAGGGVNTIVLTSNKTEMGLSSVVVNRAAFTAADILGFDPDNDSASRTGSSPARLTGNAAEPFVLSDGMTLVVSTDGLPEETVTFQASDFTDISAATAAEVVAAINSAMSNLTASAGTGNDFDIKGGDGTPEGAGRCLVEGWDAINERNLKYTAQPLANNAALAADWGVDPVPPLTTPATDRRDTVYLDLWEREVDAGEDTALVNPAIGLETCVRLKREWAVRVVEGTTTLPTPASGHVFYPLASLTRAAGDMAINLPDIVDLRLTRLSIVSQNDVQQIITDAYGTSYTLDHDGQPNLKVSLREAINALLRGESLGTPKLQLTTDAALNEWPVAFEDSDGDIWVFWESSRSGNRDIWYNRYSRASRSWGTDTQLTTDSKSDYEPFALADSSGDIWVFWPSDRRGNLNVDIWYNRYSRDRDIWTGDAPLTRRGIEPFALADSSGDIWVFWQSNRSGNDDIWYRRYNRATGSWGTDAQLTTDPESDTEPFALEDSSGDIWVFWQSNRSRTYDIWYKRYSRDSDSWEVDDHPLTTDSNSDIQPFALEDRRGDIWVFYKSYRSGTYDIWYRRYSRDSDSWEVDDHPLTTDSYSSENTRPFALEDSGGDIWVFWDSIPSGTYDIWYKRYSRASGWGADVQLTTGPDHDFMLVALGDSGGGVWVFWTKMASDGCSSDIWYKEFIPSI